MDTAGENHSFIWSNWIQWTSRTSHTYNANECIGFLIPTDAMVKIPKYISPIFLTITIPSKQLTGAIIEQTAWIILYWGPANRGGGLQYEALPKVSPMLKYNHPVHEEHCLPRRGGLLLLSLLLLL